MNNSRPDPNHETPSFLRRIGLAFGAFFGTLSSGEFAAGVERLRRAEEAPPAASSQAPAPVPPQAPPSVLKEASPDAALQLLGLLQRDGRLIDFTQENLTSYSDADIGAAARLVHDGCRKVLQEHFSIAPVRQESEGSRITLNDGFDAAAIRLTGNVAGKPPFHGSISHRGWRVTEVRLPKLVESHDASVLAPAEVEL
ncbi:DUF2760 domain-containing protein [Noviherbaspirillum cavernae]|uniref:DUF2760 domain-containing protein n=1 Tax=Noviherbaspirillum cavernae TaxID=2320862 RepID=A0A418WUY1_9BURK|nr:DUF2760 domain-containing protein [Noviherbaspirillum cavernae]RJF96463.1 DUF2760 domain-containing protein [Noviherbaspirillum cavernae]